MSGLYLVRHAQADGHDGGDPGLSEVGRDQAGMLAGRLAAPRARYVVLWPH